MTVTSVPNPHRGEVGVSLVVEGKEKSFVLRPSHTAMAEMEEELGMGAIEVLDRFRFRKFGLREVSVVVAAGLRASGNPAKTPRVAEMVYQTGVQRVATEAVRLLINMLNGGREPGEGEAEAEADRPGSTSAD